jgi:hypothetical protein
MFSMEAGFRAVLVMTLMALSIALQLMTFGVGNNDPAWVLEQHLQLGVTAAIVDNVPKVLLTLLLEDVATVSQQLSPAPVELWQWLLHHTLPSATSLRF